MEIKNIVLKISLLVFLILPNCLSSQNTEFETEIENYIEEEFNEYHDNLNLFSYFKELNWKEELSSKDKSIINSVIDLGDYRYKEMEANVMVPVLIHRLNSIDERENLFRWEEYRKYLKETKNFSDEQYDKFLLANIRSNKLKKFNNHISHYRAIDDEILNALVIRQCRLLQNGKKQTVSINKKMLNSFHKNILEQSRFSKQEAIQKLTTKMANLGIVITEKEHGILEALYGFGKEATDNTFQIVKDSKALEKFSERGEMFLLLHLLERAKIDLTIEEQDELIEYLNRKEIYDQEFKENKKIICYINNRLKNDDLVTCFEEYFKK